MEREGPRLMQWVALLRKGGRERERERVVPEKEVGYLFLLNSNGLRMLQLTVLVMVRQFFFKSTG